MTDQEEQSWGFDPQSPQIMYLQEALQRALRQHEVLARTFYDQLFASYPQTRELFSNDPERQREMFAAVLKCAADELTDPAALRPRLNELGKLHHDRGVSVSALEMGRQPFLKSIAAVIGETEFNTHRVTWDALYSLMVMGMREDNAYIRG